MQDVLQEPISSTSNNFNYQEPIGTSNVPVEDSSDTFKYQSPISSSDPVSVVPQGQDNSSYIDLEEIFEEYGGKNKLTKELIMDDPRLMEVIRSSLEARYTPGGVLTRARRSASFLSGGDIGGIKGLDYRSQDDEDVFETWQNWQRSFAGGQTVTTGQEVVYGMRADKDTKMKLGAGYKLFGDGMTNAFVGEGTLSEMGDAIWDYGKAAVWDPTTVLSFGLGKLLGFGATKTSAQVAKKAMITAYTDGIKRGATKTAALKAIGESIKKSIPFAVADATFAVGTDVGYQMQLINVDVQEEYSGAQTAFAALGSMAVIPTLTALGATAREFRNSSLAPTWLNYSKMEDDVFKLGAEEAEELLKGRVNKNILLDSVDENFGTIKGDTKDFLVWSKLKDVSDKSIKRRNEPYTDSEVLNGFFSYFWRGGVNEETKTVSKGYAQALKESGFVVHESMIEKYGTKTAVYANAINFLNDKQVRKIVNKFETDTGYKLKFIGEEGKDAQGNTVYKTVSGNKVTAKSLEAHFVRQTREAGVSLQLVSSLEKIKKEGLDTKATLELFTAIEKEQAVGRLIGAKVRPPDRSNRGTITSISGDGTYANVKFVNKKDSSEKTIRFKLKDLKYIDAKNPKISQSLDELIPDASAVLKKKTDDPARRQFVMSIYKRLLTSHLSTTGANLKGFSAMVSLNTAADFATAGINFSQSGFYKYIKGDPDAAVKFYNRAKGSALGSVRRIADTLSPDMPIGYADKILESQPEIQKRLFRDVSGDGGVRDSLETFNLDDLGGETVIWKTADGVTKGFQTLTLVRLQDDITKRWSFGTNTNQAIMREYGISPEEFFAKPDVALEMASDRFKTMVLDKAVFRTMRETASVNWSTLPANNAFRTVAKWVEDATNRTPLGFVVPFGSFLNTTIATMADLTGVNALRFGIAKVARKELDFATQEGAEAIGKWAAGWSAIGLGVYAKAPAVGSAKERLENNLAYNQELNSDGSVQNLKYDWPISTMRLMSQILAHGLGDSDDPRNFNYKEVPPELIKELALQVGGQSIRDLDVLGQSIIYAGEALVEGDTGPLIDFSKASAGRITQGFTRPLDPINQVYGMVTDKNMNPNLKEAGLIQGQMMRYVNNLFGDTQDLPPKATVTRGTEFTPDIGKQLLGNRGVSLPNLVEQMMNSAGKPYWKALGRIDAPDAIRNKMKMLASPFFEASALKYLNKYPDYFDLPLDRKQELLKRMNDETKDNMMKVFEQGMPKEMNVLRTLSSKNKDKVKNIQKEFGLEGDLEELPLPLLLQIQTLLDIYDDIFNSDGSFRIK